MTILIDGAHTARCFQNVIKQDVVHLKSQGIHPGLAIIRVKGDPASEIYVRHKLKAADRVGIHVKDLAFPKDTSQQDLNRRIQSLGADPSIHGMIVQLPLPFSWDPFSTIQCIPHAKDVDGLTFQNVGLLACQRETFVPCTPLGITILLKRYHPTSLSGQDVAIVGRSALVGRPLSHVLNGQNCTVTLLHSHSKEPWVKTAQADIVISAVGSSCLVQDTWIKPGATVIDVGITKNPDTHHITGDVDFPHVKEVAGALTPVPGGVGPMTVASLLYNTLSAARKQHDMSFLKLPLDPIQSSWQCLQSV